MKLVNYGERGRERPGLLLGDRVVDLGDELATAGIGHNAPSIVGLLERPDWRAVLGSLGPRDAGAGTPVDTVRLGPPIARPGNVYVVGANTHSHIREAASLTLGAPPRAPMILAKATSAISGPRDPIVRPAATRKLDYEVELGVVIGRPTAGVAVCEALDAVAGYLVVNDVSARDVQLAEGEDNPFYRTHYLGKSFNSFCPTGPWLVTSDELGDPSDLTLRTWVNGELRQDGSTSDLCFDVPAIIAYLSSVVTLMPGDLICTGSPSGVAAFRSPDAFLEPGDVVRCAVGGIGWIENQVVAGDAPVAPG